MSVTRKEWTKGTGGVHRRECSKLFEGKTLAWIECEQRNIKGEASSNWVEGGTLDGKEIEDELLETYV